MGKSVKSRRLAAVAVAGGLALGLSPLATIRHGRGGHDDPRSGGVRVALPRQRVEPGHGVARVVFVDCGWAQGNAQLGYGDGDEATVVSFGPNASDEVPHDVLPRARSR